MQHHESHISSCAPHVHSTSVNGDNNTQKPKTIYLEKRQNNFKDNKKSNSDLEAAWIQKKDISHRLFKMH